MSDDFSRLSEMIYSGRVLHAITTDNDEFGLGYTMTGRQPSSQARRLVPGKKTGTISVQAIKDIDSLEKMFGKKTDTPLDMEQLLKDIEKGSSALIYYPAIRPIRKKSGELVGIVGSNGIQTDLLYSSFTNPNNGSHSCLGILQNAFNRPHIMYDPQYDRDIDITNYEPDTPNNTPRINFCLKLDGTDKFGMTSVAKHKNSELRNIKEYKPFVNRGSILSLPTYFGGNEKPLVSFSVNPTPDNIKCRNFI